MKRRIIPVVLLLSFCVGALAQQAAFPLTVVDDAGNQLTLKAPPQRIVSLTLFTDEMLLSLVDKSRLIGITTFAADSQTSNVPELAAAIAHKLTMNVEEIISLAPDLAIVANWSDAAPVKQLRDAGIPVYLMASGLTVKAIEEKIQRLGLMTGEVEKAQSMIDTMDKRLAAVAAQVATIPANKRAVVMDYSTWGGAMGKGSSWDEIVRLAGLVDAVADYSADKWGEVFLSKEKILEINPDILVLPGWVYGDPNGAKSFYSQIAGDPALKGLSAVKNGRLIMMPERLKSAVSQYIVDSVEWLAKSAYPQLFP